MVRVEQGDMLEVLGRMVAEGVQVSSVVTDPPYHLTANKKGGSGEASVNLESPYGRSRITTGFMGQKWDGGDIAFRPGTWRLCYDLLPPGGHLLAFNSTRTFHRMVTAIEEAGFEIRDTIAWMYGQGFPKSLNVSKAIDRHHGDTRPVIGRERVTNDIRGGALLDCAHDGLRPAFERDITSAASAASAAWDGWGTALKPAMELICVARKPLDGTVAANVLRHGTGALNIDGCRVPVSDVAYAKNASGDRGHAVNRKREMEFAMTAGHAHEAGRHPANIVHDGSAAVIEAFPMQQSGGTPPSRPRDKTRHTYGAFGGQENPNGIGSTAGSAARFFYTAKADADDRLGSKHPTVKPVDLMRWLVRLVTPPGGTVLDPFAGSGTTGMACLAEGLDCILVEREAEYVADIRRRIAHVSGTDTPLFSQPTEPA
ncbi:MAG: site-specific DNA-methyltransferase [Reyranellaceae bacterium]